MVQRANTPNHIFILQGPELPDLGPIIEELRSPKDGQPIRATYIPPDAYSALVGRLHTQMMAAIERGEMPAVMIDMHGIASGREQTSGMHKMQLGRTTGVETPRMVETILATYERAYKETHPGKPVPPLRMLITPCYGESLWRDIKPEMLSRLDLTLGDSQSRMTWAGDEKVSLQVLAQDEGTEQRFIRTLSTPAPIIFNPLLPSAGVLQDGQAMVLDADALRRKVSVENLEQLRAAALQRVAMIPESLREEAVKKITELKAENLRNIEDAQTVALIGYLGDYNNRYTPLSVYHEPRDAIRRFIDRNTKPEELRAALSNIHDPNVLESMSLMVHYGYDSKTRNYMEERFRALNDHGVNILSGSLALSGNYSGDFRSAFAIALNIAKDKINQPDHSGDAILYQAVNLSYLPAAKAILAAGGDPNLAGSRGLTPLHRAIERGDEAMVKLLLAQPSIDVNLAGGRFGDTPLSFAMYERRDAIIKLLMDDPRVRKDLVRKDGVTLFQSAIDSGSAEAVKELLRMPTSIANPAIVNSSGFGALEMAIDSNSAATLSALLADPRFNPAINGKEGNPLAFSAVQWNKVEALTRLLSDPRIDVTLRDKEGDHLLTAAIRMQDAKREIVEALLKSGKIDPNLPNNGGWPPLHLAATFGDLEIVEALLKDRRVNPNLPNKDGMTPLQLAIEGGRADIVDMLLKDSRVNPNLLDKDGFSPIMNAIENGHVDVIKRLLQRSDIDLTIKDDRGFSLLERAVGGNNPDVIRALLADRRINPMAVGKNGRTAVHWAAIWNKPEAMATLLEDRRVDPTKLDGDGYTAAHIAVIDEKTAVLAELLKHPKVTTGLLDVDGKTLLATAMNVRNDTLKPVLDAAMKEKEEEARETGVPAAGVTIKKAVGVGRE